MSCIDVLGNCTEALAGDAVADFDLLNSAFHNSDGQGDASSHPVFRRRLDTWCAE